MWKRILPSLLLKKTSLCILTLFRNILSSDPFPAMLFWGSIWYQLTCFCLVFYWLWKSQPPMKEESRSARGAWLIYSLLYPSHSCLRWWVKMVPELCIYFGREKKKKEKQMQWFPGSPTLHLFFLVIHVDATHSIPGWLRACELGWGASDESPTVQGSLWSLPQMARTSPHLVSPSWDALVKLMSLHDAMSSLGFHFHPQQTKQASFFLKKGIHLHGMSLGRFLPPKAPQLTSLRNS